ncbi:MAG: MarR family transcriptional regulator [Cyclobacteriaceae bacterium]|nr:MarR family transcriptional regulator [Cyclobacteriaceae bacterium]
MKPEETVDYHIRAAWYGIYRMYNQEAVKYDITTSLGFVLLNLHMGEGTPATKIAPLMGMEARSLSRMLKSMEEQGLIRKEKDENDKRSVLIYLTEKGRDKREIARQTVRAFNEELLELMSKDELEVFFRAMNKINARIETRLESNKQGARELNGVKKV